MFNVRIWFLEGCLIVVKVEDFSSALQNYMSLIKETIKQGITKESVKGLDDVADRLKVWQGSCQSGLDPNYELLKRHLEVWVNRYPAEMAAFIEYRKQSVSDNLNKFGATQGGLMRKLMEIPPGLHKLFAILAPNVFGDEELTPETRKKRVRKFLKHFPVFKACEKI